jgi:hypothetical protein
MKTKFQIGDRVVVVGNKSGDAPPVGTMGTVKRTTMKEDYYVVSFDDGTGWQDYKESGVGWNIRACDIELYDGLDYDVDE